MSGSRGIRVGYVAGWGRSGSTLLAQLAQWEDVVAVGEMRFIWEAGLVENETCSCGEPFRSCPFWTAVGAEAFGGWSEVPASHLAAVSSEAFRPTAALRRTSSRDRSAQLIEELKPYTLAVYDAVLRVSGSALLLDSTKNPVYLDGLMRMGFDDVYVIHLIRDSRAVAFSWNQQTIRPEVRDGESTFPRYGYLQSAARWTISNLMVERHNKRGHRYLQIRYEDLVADVPSVVLELGSFLEVRDPESRGEATQHTLRGNPMKFNGNRPVQADTRWLNDMPRPARYAVTAGTWPLLRRYGYR